MQYGDLKHLFQEKLKFNFMAVDETNEWSLLNHHNLSQPPSVELSNGEHTRGENIRI